jgi:hypothetical protein
MHVAAMNTTPSAEVNARLQPRRLATVSNYDELIAAIRRRIDELAISHATIEDLSGLSGGHVGKLLGASRVKTIGMQTLLLLFGALGVRMSIEEDREQIARMSDRWERRSESRRHASGRVRAAVSPEVTRAVLSELGRRGAAARVARARAAADDLQTRMRELGRRGAVARNASLSPARRSRVARRAARARWRGSNGGAR